MKKNDKITRYFKWRVHVTDNEYAIEHLIELKSFSNGHCIARTNVIKDDDTVYLSIKSKDHSIADYASFECFFKELTEASVHNTELIELSDKEFYKEIMN